MVIGSKTVKRRSRPASSQLTRWGGNAVSLAGDVTVIDLGIKDALVPVFIQHMAETTSGGICGYKDLRDYLVNTVKRGSKVQVTPDYLDAANTVYDDLGIGATGAVYLIFEDITAEWQTGYLWNVTINFRYVA